MVCESIVHRICAEPRTDRCCRGGRQWDAQTAARSWSHQVLQASLCGESSSIVSGLDENQRIVFYEEHKNVCMDASR